MTAEQSSSDNRRGPLPAWLCAPAWLLSKAYGIGAASRARAFDAGRGVVRIDRPVISVGNVSTGGTGKTPMVGWILDALKNLGRSPCVAMRGYGRRAHRGLASDEARVYAGSHPDVPIVAQPDRLSGLLRLFAGDDGSGVDAVVLDDGFQHRRIARDLDLVLVDASRRPWDDRLLPLGFLREPWSALGRATHVALTHLDDERARAEIERWVARHTGAVLLGSVEHAWHGLRVHVGEDSTEVETAWLAGRRVLVAAGIGNPRPLYAQVRAAVGGSIETLALPDHEAFGDATCGRLADRARSVEAVVVTAKDWVKLAPRAHAVLGGTPVVVPDLALRFEASGERLLREGLVDALARGDADAAG